MRKFLLKCLIQLGFFFFYYFFRLTSAKYLKNNLNMLEKKKAKSSLDLDGKWQ